MLWSLLKGAWAISAVFETSSQPLKNSNTWWATSPIFSQAVMGCDTQSRVPKETTVREKSGRSSFPCHHSGFSTHIHQSPRDCQDLKRLQGQVQQGLPALSCPVRCEQCWVLEEDWLLLCGAGIRRICSYNWMQGEIFPGEATINMRRVCAPWRRAIPLRRVKLGRGCCGRWAHLKRPEKVLFLHYTLLNQVHFPTRIWALTLESQWIRTH